MATCTTSVDHENDLPVLANTSQILVHHFMLDLQCNLQEQQCSGSILVFLDPAKSPDENRQIFSIQDAGLLARDGEVQSDPVAAGPHPAPDIPVQKELETNLSGRFSSQNVPTASTSAAATNQSEPALETNTMENFQLVLDCCNLIFDGVEEVTLPPDLYSSICGQFSTCYGSPEVGEDLFVQCRGCGGMPLRYTSEKWCIKVWKEGVKEAEQFPRVVRIRYRTTAEGQSLRWAKDQSGSPCVYSAAMWVNNRALLPCQEYGSLGTWQAAITVPESHIVLMSSDYPEHRMAGSEDGLVSYYHQCSSPLPSYCLALAVGSWEQSILVPWQQPSDSTDSGLSEPLELFLKPTCHHSPACQICYSRNAVLPSRIFAPPSLLEQARQEFSEYYPKCSRAVQQILGASPFGRVDFVFFPACSQDMAMSNGGLVFLSQSMLATDGSMCIRLSHELTHFWFGLLIGAKDWTEEWLSEGFATYMEDSVHALAMRWDDRELRDYSELRALLRYRVLQAEMENTQDQLQTLRPQKGQELRDAETSVMYVKNGMNPNKLFTQVHYLKGYFLLRHLANLVGVARFNTLMKDYIIRYHGCLVYSQDFLGLVLDTFPELVEQGVSLDNLFADWLDCPGMPKHLKEFSPSCDNSLYSTAREQLGIWNKVENSNRKCRKKKRQKCDSSNSDFPPLEANQLVLLLEEILQWKKLSVATLRQLSDTYRLSTANADVRHRWCELIVKHRHSEGYTELKNFLIHDQAMGVYLYGEMVISGNQRLKTIAEEAFNTVAPDMEPGTYQTVHAMLYGS